MNTSIVKRSPFWLLKKKINPRVTRGLEKPTRVDPCCGILWVGSGRVEENFQPTRRVTRVGVTRVGALATASIYSAIESVSCQRQNLCPIAFLLLLSDLILTTAESVHVN